MKPQFIIDSYIDGEYVKLEDYHDALHYMIFEKSVLPVGAKLGDVLGEDESGDFVILENESLRKESIQKKFERILKRGN